MEDDPNSHAEHDPDEKKPMSTMQALGWLALIVIAFFAILAVGGFLLANALTPDRIGGL